MIWYDLRHLSSLEETVTDCLPVLAQYTIVVDRFYYYRRGFDLVSQLLEGVPKQSLIESIQERGRSISCSRFLRHGHTDVLQWGSRSISTRPVPCHRQVIFRTPLISLRRFHSNDHRSFLACDTDLCWREGSDSSHSRDMAILSRYSKSPPEVSRYHNAADVVTLFVLVHSIPILDDSPS